jgi:exodeoxyribonuclease-3
MILASWNINSVRIRAEQLKSFLLLNNVDVALLQETKCPDKDFPREIFEDCGYNIALFGQKSYNGVAILSKRMIEEVVLGPSIFKNDNQARYIEALINGYTIASVYVPNGVSSNSEHFFYKLDFLKTLFDHTRNIENLIIGGDFNIALTDNDVYDPILWKEKICCTTVERNALSSFIAGGLVDSVRCLHKDEEIYSWWDYRRNSFLRNNGLRLDYIFTSDCIIIKDARVAKETRQQERPSDHAPIIVNV